MLRFSTLWFLQFVLFHCSTLYKLVNFCMEVYRNFSLRLCWHVEAKWQKYSKEYCHKVSYALIRTNPPYLIKSNRLFPWDRTQDKWLKNLSVSDGFTIIVIIGNKFSSERFVLIHCCQKWQKNKPTIISSYCIRISTIASQMCLTFLNFLVIYFLNF